MLADQETRYRAEALRPPGAASTRDFAELCTGCGDCADICPSGLIYLGPDLLARLRTSRGCGECGLCADVCSHGAIELTPRMRDGLRQILIQERTRDVPL
ncbi:ferredoxin [Roseovarius sp. MBR-154]|jgi:ferredoxin